MSWLTAGLWGVLAASALLIGAAVAWVLPVPRAVVASVMAFGAGVLISAVAFDLIEKAADTGGGLPTALGAVGGAFAFFAGDLLLDRWGARHRKAPGAEQLSEEEQPGSGLAIALGALLDGVPESLVLGLGLVTGGAVSPALVSAVFLSNFPEGMASAAGMKASGRSAGYVFGVWGGIVGASGLAAAVGYGALAGAQPRLVALITAIAAGAILTMVADTMIPEAFERTRTWTGVLTTLGFLLAFAIDRLAG